MSNDELINKTIIGIIEENYSAIFWGLFKKRYQTNPVVECSCGSHADKP